MPRPLTTWSIEPNLASRRSVRSSQPSLPRRYPRRRVRVLGDGAKPALETLREMSQPRYSRDLENAWTTAAPMPCEAPVTMTVFLLVTVSSSCFVRRAIRESCFWCEVIRVSTGQRWQWGEIPETPGAILKPPQLSCGKVRTPSSPLALRCLLRLSQNNGDDTIGRRYRSAAFVAELDAWLWT